MSLAISEALSAGDSVDFRIFIGTGIDARHVVLDNVTVNGTTVVPEPASLVLAGVGLSALTVRRPCHA